MGSAVEPTYRLGFPYQGDLEERSHNKVAQTTNSGGSKLQVSVLRQQNVKSSQ